jgi:type I restriction enzyme S subunit
MKASPKEGILENNFLFYFLSAPRIQNLIISESSRTAGQSGIRKELLYDYPTMLPPLAEQHRIVAKVDELMALCDQLKNSLQQAQETQIQLTDAVVENAL